MKRYRILSSVSDGRTETLTTLYATEDPRGTILLSDAIARFVTEGVPKLRPPTPGNARPAVVLGVANPQIFAKFAGQFVNPDKLFAGGVTFESQADLARALGFKPPAFAVHLTQKRNAAAAQGLPVPSDFVVRGLKIRLNEKPTTSVQ